jgi:hypothetical protein
MVGARHATQERQVEESCIFQHQEIDEGRIQTEASGSNRADESGKIQEEKEEGKEALIVSNKEIDNDAH